MQSQPLISTTELAAQLSGVEPPALLDVRWALAGPSGLAAYQTGHLQGAVYVDLDTQLAAPVSPGTGRHPMPRLSDLQVAARGWGLRQGQSAVVYDDSGGMSAARAWWLLRWAGVSDVRVLDGGLAAWTAEGRPVVSETSGSRVGDVTLRAGNMPVLDATQAGELARVGILLDARAVERYRGETEPLDPVAGHIPGAESAPTAENLDPDGRFKSVEELRTRFSELGVLVPTPASNDSDSDTGTHTGTHTGDDTDSGTHTDTGVVGVYCGSGITAAHEILALASLGITASLYPGSWSEWITDPSRPIAIGDRT
jgi:thiosulfate/3-mercaptopyruvate sulfurtransferase